MKNLNDYTISEIWTGLKLDKGTIFSVDRLEDETFVITADLKTSDGFSTKRVISSPPVLKPHDHDAILQILKLELSVALLYIEELREKAKGNNV